MYVEPPQIFLSLWLQTENLVNRSMHDMYRTSNSRKNSEDEALAQTDVNSPQTRTHVVAKSHESLTKTSLPNNQSVLNENDKNYSSKFVVNGQTPELKSERPNVTSDTMGSGKQHPKTTKKEKGYSRSKDYQRKTSTKDNLMDDSGTFAVDIVP